MGGRGNTLALGERQISVIHAAIEGDANRASSLAQPTFGSAGVVPPTATRVHAEAMGMM